MVQPLLPIEPSIEKTLTGLCLKVSYSCLYKVVGNHLSLAWKSINIPPKNLFSLNHHGNLICRMCASTFFKFWKLTYTVLFHQLVMWSRLWQLKYFSTIFWGWESNSSAMSLNSLSSNPSPPNHFADATTFSVSSGTGRKLSELVITSFWNFCQAPLRADCFISLTDSSTIIKLLHMEKFCQATFTVISGVSLLRVAR